MSLGNKCIKVMTIPHTIHLRGMAVSCRPQTRLTQSTLSLSSLIRYSTAITQVPAASPPASSPSPPSPAALLAESSVRPTLTHIPMQVMASTASSFETKEEEGRSVGPGASASASFPTSSFHVTSLPAVQHEQQDSSFGVYRFKVRCKKNVCIK